MPRNRKPSALKIAEGVHKSKINQNEPKAKGPLAEPPAGLDQHAAFAWSWLRDQGVGMGVITSAEWMAVSLFVEQYSRWVKARESIVKHGLTVDSQFGLKAHPAVLIADRAHHAMMKVLVQFGMTPASRAGLQVVSSPEDDPLLAYFCQTTPAQSKAR